MFGFIRRRRKRTLVLAAVVLALAISGTALAVYFSIGSGSTSSGPVALGNVSTEPVIVTNQGCVSNCSNPLFPGDMRSFSIRIQNNNSDTVTLGQVTGSVDAGSLPAGCSPSWFSVDSFPLNTTLGSSSHLDTGPIVVHFNSIGGSQNACAGATITYTFTVGP